MFEALHALAAERDVSITHLIDTLACRELRAAGFEVPGYDPPGREPTRRKPAPVSVELPDEAPIQHLLL